MSDDIEQLDTRIKTGEFTTLTIQSAFATKLEKGFHSVYMQYKSSV